MLKFRWETEFKETEIGNIPKDWEVKRIGEIFNVKAGKRPLKIMVDKNNDLAIPIFGANGFMGYTNTYLIEGEAVITGRVGTLGRFYFINDGGKVWVSDNALFLKPKRSDIICKFYYYHLQLRKLDEILNIGTTQPLITQTDLGNTLVPYPPPEEQTRIATVLSWFDDLIENKKRQNEILEKTAMTIFKSWFIDFEPFQDEEFVYNEELDMEIPEGWEVKKLGSIVEFKYGKSLPKRKRKPGPYPVVGSSGIVGHHNEYLVKGPTVIIGRKGNVGTVRLIMEPNYPIDTVFYSSPNIPKELVFYIYHYLKLNSPENVASTDTAVPGLNINLLNFMGIIIPPQQVLQHFHSLVEPLFQKIINNQKQIMILKKIRDTLLPQLVFGRLRVEEI